MDERVSELKQSIEDRIISWKKLLEEKDDKINKLIEEKRLLQNEMSRKMMLRPALKERIMSDVGRITAKLQNDLRKSQVNERDVSSRLDSLKEKLSSSQAEIAAQKNIIDNLKYGDLIEGKTFSGVVSESLINEKVTE